VKHAVTPKVERLVHDLRAISQEIEPQIHLVSQAARDEWTALQASWPSEEDLREGTTALPESEFRYIEIKVRRFQRIVQNLGTALPLTQRAPRSVTTSKATILPSMKETAPPNECRGSRA
jgi:hypothetical protein